MSAEDRFAPDQWQAYYDAMAGKPPRDTLVFALERFTAEGRPPGFAADLGCGEGRDTTELLRCGWRVLAVDAQPVAIERLRARPDLPGDAADRLDARVLRFEDVVLPVAAVDLVNASFSLPFCPAAAFPALWGQIVAALRPGGRFAGQLFGERDTWALGPNPLCCHTRAEAEALLRPFDIDRFDEVEEDGTTATGSLKHWHVFHVVARKR